jgi:hypothetical protein
LRVASVFAAVCLVLFGILVGVRAVGSSTSEVAHVIEPATAAGKGEPAEADILFKTPVEVDEVLMIVGEENRDNLATVEGSFRAGGEEIGDSFSVPSRLGTAEEIERAWARARTGALVDMSQSSGGSADDGLRAQAGGMKGAISDHGVREILVTKASLEGDSRELELLPAHQSSAIKNISVITRRDLIEMFERVRKEAKRRRVPPPKFDQAGLRAKTNCCPLNLR